MDFLKEGVEGGTLVMMLCFIILGVWVLVVLMLLIGE
jgi:hypothetical protein